MFFPSSKPAGVICDGLTALVFNIGVLVGPLIAYGLCQTKICMSKIASHPAYQNSLIKNFTVPFLKYKRLKLKLRVFLAGPSIAMVTNCVMKIIPTCSPMIGQFFDTMIVASIDKEW